MISSRSLAELPAIDVLRKLTQSLAMLDAIIQRDWEGRYYSFNAYWKPDEQMASMRNGEGDEWFCLFMPVGAFLKGLYHESQKARAGRALLDSVPEVFQSALTEPAFSIQYTSFCAWRTYEDDQWHTGRISYPPGEDPDGSAWMLAILDGNPVRYQRWAEDYYTRPVSLSAVEHIYAYKPLTKEIVHSLNPETNLSDLGEDIAKIGYPTA